MVEKISLKSSSESILDGACTFHETALECDPEATFLLAHFVTATGTLKSVNDVERDKGRALMKSRAKRGFQDVATDRAVVAFESAMFIAVKKNPADPAYSKYFQKRGSTPITTAPIEIEIKLLGTIVDQLTAAVAAIDKAKPTKLTATQEVEKTHLPLLSAAHAALDATHKAVGAAVQAHANAFANEREARTAVARQLEIDEAELMKLFGKGRRLQSFFLRREDASPTQAEEQDAGEEGKGK